mmetsp:Transcript_3139/g.8950  ORF Transcript_3139/g.8950 Transcript_3139/m.8950 type:complete len:214 (+) Transcript_3139:1535-2176(+)
MPMPSAHCAVVLAPSLSTSVTLFAMFSTKPGFPCPCSSSSARPASTTWSRSSGSVAMRKATKLRLPLRLVPRSLPLKPGRPTHAADRKWAGRLKPVIRLPCRSGGRSASAAAASATSSASTVRTARSAVSRRRRRRPDMVTAAASSKLRTAARTETQREGRGGRVRPAGCGKRPPCLVWQALGSRCGLARPPGPCAGTYRRRWVILRRFPGAT